MTVKEYIAQLPNADAFLALTEPEQDAYIFQANETLMDHYSPRKITTRVLALQALYWFEGEGEDFNVLKRQGVSKFSTEGLSVEFGSGAISPDVIAIIEKGGRAKVGSIV